MNGYGFSEETRRALGEARAEAARLRHEYVGTEHLLLGMIVHADSVATAVLLACDIDPQEVRAKVEETVVKGRVVLETGPDLPYTSRAKKILELAMEYAQSIGSDHVNTGHLLIGTLREEKGIAAQVLTYYNLSVEAAGRALAKLMNTEFKDVPFRPVRQVEQYGRDLAAMLQMMSHSPRVLGIFRKHGIDVPALIDDLLRLDQQ